MGVFGVFNSTKLKMGFIWIRLELKNSLYPAADKLSHLSDAGVAYSEANRFGGMPS